MQAIMPDTVYRLHNIAVMLLRDGSSGIRISVESRKIATRDFQPYAMPRREHIRRGTQVYVHLVSGTRVHQDRRLERLTVASPQNSVRNDRGHTIGRNVDQLRREVRVTRCRRDKGLQRDVTCHFDGVVERGG